MRHQGWKRRPPLLTLAFLPHIERGIERHGSGGFPSGLLLFHTNKKFFKMRIDLTKPVRRSGQLDPFDVRKIKKALNRLGYYMPFEGIGITDFSDDEMFQGLRAFQRQRGLVENGEIRADDETLKALNDALSVRPRGLYIWRVRSNASRCSRFKRAEQSFALLRWVTIRCAVSMLR
ncbi:MAG: hypothetical protein GC137_06725 [Alphaproteobacteria bacterium]|nr:hypothetical protein [Alphaproteobacteria bacterium]